MTCPICEGEHEPDDGCPFPFDDDEIVLRWERARLLRALLARAACLPILIEPWWCLSCGAFHVVRGGDVVRLRAPQKGRR